MARKVLPERFKALKERSKMQQKLERRLEDLGLGRSEWEDPLSTIEQLAAMRTIELLADPELSNRDRIRAVEMAFKTQPLGGLASMRRQQDAQAEFQRRFAKKEVTRPPLELLTAKTTEPNGSYSLPNNGRFLPGAQAADQTCEIEGFPRTPVETIVGTPPGRMIGLAGLLM